MKRLLMLPLVAACRGGDAHPDGEPTTSDDVASADVTPTNESLGADSTAAPPEPSCVDDYHGNQDALAALDLGLDTSTSAVVVLGDGLIGSPAELGADQLIVCDASPSDFFTVEALLPGYLAVEARRLEGGVPDLVLYAGGQPVEQINGDWYGFFLKPLQRKIDANTYVMEVRHPGGAPVRYSLAVMVLPTSAGP